MDPIPVALLHTTTTPPSTCHTCPSLPRPWRVSLPFLPWTSDIFEAVNPAGIALLYLVSPHILRQWIVGIGLRTPVSWITL